MTRSNNADQHAAGKRPGDPAISNEAGTRPGSSATSSVESAPRHGFEGAGSAQGERDVTTEPGNPSRSSLDMQAMPAASGPRTSDGRPDYPTRPEDAETVEQVRGAIDSGRTHDKIAATDPAAAPLGSDAEAGQPHDEAGLKTARQAQARTGSR